MSNHSSYCKCSDCMDPDKDFEKWITQKSRQLVEMHLKFNHGRDDSFDPGMVTALLRTIGKHAKEYAESLHVKRIQLLQAEAGSYRHKIEMQGLEIRKLTKSLETREVSLTVPDTDGRLFRQD